MVGTISLYIKQRGICLFVCLLAWLSGMASHALYGMAPCFGHTGVTFDAENDRPGPGSLRGHFEAARGHLRVCSEWPAMSFMEWLPALGIQG